MKKLISTAILFAGCAIWPVLGADSPVVAGILRGTVHVEATGQPLGRATVRAYPHRRSVALQTMTENDGAFVLSEVPAGLAAVCVAAEECYRPIYCAAVAIPPKGSAELHLHARRTIAVEGDSWLRAQQSFSQSYRATGLALTALQIKAFGPARRVCVQILNGSGPDAEPIGPARRSEPVGGEGSTAIAFSGAEVSTIPGHTYTIRMTAVDTAGWIPGVAGRGNVYPLGKAWFDDSPRDHTDLGIAICEDNDGSRTDYALLTPKRMYRAISCGQTFVALSDSICYARARLAGVDDVDNYVRFSIHRNGPGGPQIGPSKAVAACRNAMVAWGPQEIPVEPGDKYYLHVESLSARPFLAAYHDDSYSAGCAVFGGEFRAEKDLVAVIAGRTSRADFARLMTEGAESDSVELSSPSFEDGLGVWRQDASHGSVVGCDAGFIPCWGSKMFGWTNRTKGQDSRTVVYQQVKVESGKQYRFSGWIFTHQKGGRSSDVKVRLLALPAGGTDVRNDKRFESSQWYATDGRWCRGSVTFVARADRITVGFDIEQRFSLASNSLYVDAAHLMAIEENP